MRIYDRQAKTLGPEVRVHKAPRRRRRIRLGDSCARSFAALRGRGRLTRFPHASGQWRPAWSIPASGTGKTTRRLQAWIVAATLGSKTFVAPTISRAAPWKMNVCPANSTPMRITCQSFLRPLSTSAWLGISRRFSIHDDHRAALCSLRERGVCGEAAFLPRPR